MTFPDATILELSERGIHPTTLADTSHYQITKGILAQPESYWRHLTTASAPSDSPEAPSPRRRRR